MRSRRNKLGMAACLLALSALAVSTQIGLGCAYNDNALLFANGNLFVLEMLGSPRSEGFGPELTWTGFRFWRPKSVSDEPSFGSSGIIIPWILSVLVFGGLLHVLWRRSDRNQDGQIRCQTCGYNLTGNASGTCPECGEPT